MNSGQGGGTHGIQGYSQEKVGGRFLCHSTLGEGPICLVANSSSAAPTHGAEKGTLHVTSTAQTYINTDGSGSWDQFAQGGVAMTEVSEVLTANSLPVHTAPGSPTIPEATWTSVGATGSGADYIWTDLDTIDVNTSSF